MKIGKSGRIHDHECSIHDHGCTANGYGCSIHDHGCSVNGYGCSIHGCGYDPGVSRFLDTAYVLWTRMGEISMPIQRADFQEDGGRFSVLPGECRGATDDNSPAFQCRVGREMVASPAGTTEFSRPCGTYGHVQTPQALKRRAIVGLSRWDRKATDDKAASGVPGHSLSGRCKRQQASGHDAQAWAKNINAHPTRGFSRGRRMFHPLLGGEGRGEDGRSIKFLRPSDGRRWRSRMRVLICFDARPHLNPLPRGEDFGIHARSDLIDRKGWPSARTGLCRPGRGWRLAFFYLDKIFERFKFQIVKRKNHARTLREEPEDLNDSLDLTEARVRDEGKPRLTRDDVKKRCGLK